MTLDEDADWHRLGLSPHCSGSIPHPIPPHNAVVMAIVGPHLSGKDHIIKAIASDCSRAGTTTYSLEPDPIDRQRWGRNADITSPLDRRQVLRVEVRPKGSAKLPGSVWVYNTGGEEVWPTAENKVGLNWLGKTDVIVFAVPPPALPRFYLHPELGVYREKVDSIGVQDPETMADGIAMVRKHMRLATLRQTVVLALTKCDRYPVSTGFPRELRANRRGAAGSKDILAVEQQQLAAFLVRSEAAPLLDAAGGIARPVFLCSIAGAGADARDDEAVAVDEVRPAPDPDGSRRAVDLIHIALMRHRVADHD
ncbi:hypothetical protein QQX13_02455 [Demequina sp. SYSU T00068]|uniref:hypothetical protein n=1 Tax=Demequina lignilytica TaxID=3051663 RepID=UPI00260CCA40|nr:hypothetical protein [Demequina sp. SYSU T00068]MDN4489686.1 hypothetical protein [Demequina sp. SYSU T00068]